MAYAINKNRKSKGGERKGLTGLASSIFGSSQKLNQNTQPKIHFYELEASEVLDVIVNDEHPLFESYVDIGKIKARKVNSQFDVPLGDLLWIKPMDSNIKELPVQGEYVMVQRLFGQYFYSSRINLFNNPNNASYQGFSKQFQLHDGNKKRSKTLETANTGISQNRQARIGRKLGESFESNFNFLAEIKNDPLIIAKLVDWELHEWKKVYGESYL